MIPAVDVFAESAGFSSNIDDKLMMMMIMHRGFVLFKLPNELTAECTHIKVRSNVVS